MVIKPHLPLPPQLQSLRDLTCSIYINNVLSKPRTDVRIQKIQSIKSFPLKFCHQIYLATCLEPSPGLFCKETEHKCSSHKADKNGEGSIVPILRRLGKLNFTYYGTFYRQSINCWSLNRVIRQFILWHPIPIALGCQSINCRSTQFKCTYKDPSILK